jgi:hypothetical protein
MRTFIDTEGRLFGRVNLVDAAIGAFVVLLIPLAYGAVLLFRPAAPRIISVEPAPLTFTEDRAALGSELAGKVKIRGEALRPVLRAEIGGQDALAYIFEDPATADVLFGNLPSGQHDLVLFDGVTEVARAPKAITIPEKPRAALARVRVVGTLLDLTDTAVREPKVGAKYPSDTDVRMEIVALGEPEPARTLVNSASEVGIAGRWQRSVVLQVGCQMPVSRPRECVADGVIVTPGYVLPISGTAGRLRLFMELVLPDGDAHGVVLRARFMAYPGLIDLLKVGDRDRPHWAIDGRGAVIAELRGRRSMSGEVAVGLLQEGFAPTAEVKATDQVAAVDATLRLGLDQSRTGWRYRSDLLRVGGPITFTTPTYTVRGVILSMTIPQVNASETNGSR